MEKWKKSEFQNTCVKIEHVTKRFGEDLVLKEVNLTLKVGQVYGVVGNNGSGKTVLMKCICGFLPVTTGTIRVFGKEIGRDVDFPESLGVIIETPGFLTQYTGVKNLEILADMKRMISKADIRPILKKSRTGSGYEKAGWKVLSWNAATPWDRTGHYGRSSLPDSG